MGTRRVKGDMHLRSPFPVATAQAVEVLDAVSLVGGTIVRAADTTWATAVATASAPTVADVALAFGSGLTNAATGVKVAYIFPWGEGALSNAGSVTPTANGGIELAAVALPSPAVALAVYVETAAASGTYKLYRITHGEQILITGYGIGRVPPTAALSDATTVTQYTFAQAFAGIAAQRKVANVARIIGSSADNEIMVYEGGIFEFDCAAAQFDLGDYVGMAKDTGNALLSQKVVEVTHRALAIGRATRKYGSNTTRVEVEIFGGVRAQQPNVGSLTE